jgi:hypothetical protein
VPQCEWALGGLVFQPLVSSSKGEIFFFLYPLKFSTWSL